MSPCLRENPSDCRAVLFDFDGVIADTMQGNLRAWQAAFAELGVRIGAEDYLPLEGMSPSEVARALGKLHGMDEVTAQKAPAIKEGLFLANETCPVFPGAVELLQALSAAGKALALVTGASRMRLEAILPRDIRAMFAACVTAESVPVGKPSPDPFLRAAGELGVAQNAENQKATHAWAFCLAPGTASAIM